MSVIVTEQIKRFSIDEYLAIAEVLDHPRTQLLEGIIYTMKPDKPFHSHCLNNLRSALEKTILKAHGLRAWTQSPIRVEPPLAGHPSLPEPDAALVPDQRYDTKHPTRTLFVAEGLSQDEEIDRVIKSRVYAKIEAPEYWLIDPSHETIEVLYLEGTAYLRQAFVDHKQDSQAVIRLKAVPITIGLASIFGSS